MTRRLASLWRFVRPERRTLAVTFLFSLLGTGASLYAPLLTRRLVDDVILRGDWPAFPRLLATMVLFGAAGSVLGGFSSYLYTRGSSRILVAMRAALFEHLERAEMRFFARTRVGEIVARLNNDMVEVQGVLVDVPLAFVPSVLRLGIASAILISMSWSLFLIGNVLVPLGALGLWLTRDVITRMSRELREKNAAVGTHIIDTFTGIRLVRGSATEGQELQRFERENLSLVASVLRYQWISSLSRGIPSFVLACSATLALLYGGYMVRDGAITVGTLVAFTAFQVQVISPIRNLLGQYVALRKGKASLARVFEFFDVPAEEDAEGAVAFNGVAKGIVFEGVTFAYGAEGRVLDGLSLEIPAGGTFALVGESGAGKSTLVDLLLRFYEPQGGEIRLDGVPLRELSLASLRSMIGVVSQDPVILNDTVHANIAYGRPEALGAEVEAAARAANAHNFIVALPAGYDTFLGERGTRLSGGQRQRIAIARALLRDPPILLLDEATSALDPESERLVQEAMDRLMQHRTVLVVAHRLATILDSDEILVLDAGRLVERGRHGELLAANGLYRRLFDLQFRGAEVLI